MPQRQPFGWVDWDSALFSLTVTDFEGGEAQYDLDETEEASKREAEANAKPEVEAKPMAEAEEAAKREAEAKAKAEAEESSAAEDFHIAVEQERCPACPHKPRLQRCRRGRAPV